MARTAKGQFQGKSPFFEPHTWTKAELQTWLQNHQDCIDAGVNVGQIQMAKAAKIRLELNRR